MTCSTLSHAAMLVRRPASLRFVGATADVITLTCPRCLAELEVPTGQALSASAPLRLVPIEASK